MSNRSDPLKIWLVDPINYSGMAYYDAGLAGGLADAGTDVTLLGSSQPLVSPAPRERLQTEPIFVGTGPGRPRWQRAIAYTRSTARLTRAIRQRPPDWLLWNYVEQPTLDGFAIRQARAVGTRIGFIAHEIEPWESDDSRHSMHKWLIEEAADAVIIHGATNAKALTDAWDIRDDRVIVGEHGDYREWVDPSADDAMARRTLGLPLNAPTALFFGTLRMSKGLEVLVEAWPAVREAVPSAELVVAGRPYRGTDLAALELTSDGITLRAGEISAVEATAYYAAADIVVLPYDQVSTSGVLRFAYSAGRPVVATDTGELGVHVTDGETGRLVPKGDQAALSRALAEMLADRDKPRAMRSAAKTYADAHFDWALIAEDIATRLEGWQTEA